MVKLNLVNCFNTVVLALAQCFPNCKVHSLTTSESCVLTGLTALSVSYAQTLQQRDKRQKLQEKRKALLEARLTKVRQRKLKQQGGGVEGEGGGGESEGGGGEGIADFDFGLKNKDEKEKEGVCAVLCTFINCHATISHTPCAY